MKMLSCWFLVLSQLISFSAKADDLQLKGINVEQKDALLQIHFDLNGTPKTENLDVRFVRRTIEWDLKGVSLSKAKIFQDIESQQVSNVYITKGEENTTRVRVNLDKGLLASDFQERLSFSHQGTRLTLMVNSNGPLVSSANKEMSRSYALSAAVDRMSAHLESTANYSAGGSTAAVTAENLQLTPVEPEPAVVQSEIDLNAPESEIPLNVKSEKTASTEPLSPQRMALGGLVIAVLLASFFLVSKKINSKRLNAAFNHDSIKVISQKYLGPKRNLTLVRVAGEYMLLGVTDHSISMIKTLSVVDDEIPELSPGDFSTAIKNLTKPAQPAALEEAAIDIEDRFSVSSLSDVKNIMRTRKYIDEPDF